MTIPDILRIFESEFGVIKSKFCIVDITLDKADKPTNQLSERAGVYVFWKDGQVIKVGRSFSNARTRALEHIRDNTEGRMAVLRGDTATHLILFTVSDTDCHWPAALEVFFELRLHPSIRSGRIG